MPNIIRKVNYNGTEYLIGATEDNNGNTISSYYATKNELNNLLINANSMVYKGIIQTANDIPTTHYAGWTYRVSTAGTYVGQVCEEGDLIICVADGTVASNNDWTVVQKNVDKALFRGANSFTNGNMLLADGTAGQVKSVAVNPTLTLTQGDANNAPKIKATIGSLDSNVITLSSATTGVYGVTKLTNTVSSTVENLAATPKLVSTAVSNAIGGLDKSDTADSTKYVSAVSETDGVITVSRASFSPSVSIANGTSSAGPAVSVTVAGNTSSAVNIPAATTGLYGVTKLSSTSSSTAENVAATPKGVWAAINTLDGTISGSAGTSKTLSAFSQTDGKVSATFSDIAIAASQVTSGTLAVARGGTGATSIENIQAGKDGSGNTITSTYATKTELNNLLAAADAMVFKGTITVAADVPNPPYNAGWTYKVATAGTYAGKVCEVGDLFICTVDKESGTTASNDDWVVVQTNLDTGLYKGSNTFVNGQMLLADGTAGKVKATNIGTTLTLTQGTSSATPKIQVTVGGVASSNSALNSATTGIYGVTKLSSTASSTEESLAATPKLVSTSISSAINALDVTDEAVSSQYISSVSETDGKISVSRTNFSPSISFNSGTTDTGPTATISIAGNTATSGGIGTATTGVYGVTKLTNATNSTSESLAATAKAVKAAYDLAASKTANVGTITGVTAGTGLSGGGTSGTVTINHSNSIDAITTEGLYKVKFDAQGHITGALKQNITDNTSNTDVTSTDTNLITARTLYYQLAKKGYTTNTGTVTSITLTSGDGITVSNSGTAITTSGSRTITHATPTGASATTYNSSGGSRTYVKTITTDKFGHITGLTTGSETVTDTHYTAKNITTNSSSSKTQTTSALTNGNVYLNLIENDTVRSTHKISGSNLIGVTTDASGNIGISHTAPTGASNGSKGSTGRTYLQTITTDAYGHVTGYTTASETVTNTDTKQNITLATTSKAYLTGVTTTPTTAAQALTGVADTGVYLTTTAGEINATQYKINEKAYMHYITSSDAIGFTFV